MRVIPSFRVTDPEGTAGRRPGDHAPGIKAPAVLTVLADPVSEVLAGRAGALAGGHTRNRVRQI